MALAADDIAPVLREAGVAAGRFFGWWWRELRELVPASWLRPLHRRRRWLLLEATGHGLTAGWQTVDGFEPAAAADDDDLRRAARRCPVAIRLPATSIWRQQLQLPLEAETSLRAILQNALERETPFLAEQVLFDHRIVERDRTLRLLTVEMAIIRRDALQPLLEQANLAGFSPRMAGFAIAGEWPPSFSFLPAAPGAPPVVRRIVLALLAVTAMLAIACAWLWHGHRAAELAMIEREIVSARVEADAALALRDQLDALTRQQAFLERRKAQSGSLELLDELSRLLPDGSWAVELRLQEGNGAVVGFAPSASALIEIFTRSPRLANPKFRSPVTPASQASMERFDIAFTLRELPR
jgi:general secretion pathway protein L